MLQDAVATAESAKAEAEAAVAARQTQLEAAIDRADQNAKEAAMLRRAVQVLDCCCTIEALPSADRELANKL